MFPNGRKFSGSNSTHLFGNPADVPHRAGAASGRCRPGWDDFATLRKSGASTIIAFNSG
jgi:hypothetical protein